MSDQSEPIIHRADEQRAPRPAGIYEHLCEMPGWANGVLSDIRAASSRSNGSAASTQSCGRVRVAERMSKAGTVAVDGRDETRSVRCLDGPSPT